MSTEYIRNSRLKYMASYVERAVPHYNIKQSDPLLASREGVGNCVAKAVIAGVLLEYNDLRGGAQPTLAWNKNTHPKKLEDMIGRISLLNGHAMLLATNNGEQGPIACLAFNPFGQEADDWDVDDFNSTDEYAVRVGEQIVPTPLGIAAGYVIKEWHGGGKEYLEALGVHDSVYHAMSREEISEHVIANLRGRDLLTDPLTP